MTFYTKLRIIEDGRGLNPRKQAEAVLKENGMTLFRKGANHDLYLDPITKEMIPLSRSSHFDDNDLILIAIAGLPAMAISMKGVRREIEIIKRRREALKL